MPLKPRSKSYEGQILWEDSNCEEHTIVFTAHCSIEHNYGADYDGNRGVTRSSDDYDFEYPDSCTVEEKADIFDAVKAETFLLTSMDF